MYTCIPERIHIYEHCIYAYTHTDTHTQTPDYSNDSQTNKQVGIYVCKCFLSDILVYKYVKSTMYIHEHHIHMYTHTHTHTHTHKHTHTH